jgi:hypothetical protein
MKIRLTILAVIISVVSCQLSAFAAITERYVTSTGTDTYANSTNIATPMSLTTAVANAAAGDRINIKVGTYTRTATDTLTNSGTATSPIIYRGYSSTIGDGNLGRTGSNGELITTNMPLLSYNSTFRLTSGNFTVIESLNISGTISNNVLNLANDCVAKSCKIVNASTNAAAIALGVNVRSIAFDNDAELSGASGGNAAINATAAPSRAIANRVKGGPAIGILCASSSAIIDNVIFAQAGVGISMNSTGGIPVIYGNTIVVGTGDAIDVITGTTGLQCIVNNLITDNAGNGIDMVSAANAGFLAYNRLRDNGTAINSGTDWVAATSYGHVTTDTGGPETDYTNSGGNDYSLIPASPAKGAGWFAFASIGALQPQSASGGVSRGRLIP